MHPSTSIKGCHPVLGQHPPSFGCLASLAHTPACLCPSRASLRCYEYTLAYAQCCQLGIGTCGSCQHGRSAMLPTGVTAPTAHSGRHGNKDEHSYLCPYIHGLCFPDKLSFSLCISSCLSSPISLLLFLSLYLFLCLLPTWLMTISRELEVWVSSRGLYELLKSLSLLFSML